MTGPIKTQAKDIVKMDIPGRPSVWEDGKTLQKMEEAFSWGCSDAEACLYAEIAPATLYNYCKKHPEFLERKEQLKRNPLLLARHSRNKGMKSDAKLSHDFLKYTDGQQLSGTIDGKEINVKVSPGIGSLLDDIVGDNKDKPA